MLPGLFVLLACQLVGETIVRALGLPIPGPVLGIILLVAVLALRQRVTGHDSASDTTNIGQAADGLLRYLGLLFVPAGVGIVQSFGLVTANGPALIGALVLSTLLTLIVTVAVFRLVARRSKS
jgi:putative effector of murein hydrolase LrgA (UPF0299 family)